MRNQRLDHFIGKVCTIFTTPVNRNLQQENPETYLRQVFTYFVGIVDFVDDNGVMLTQIGTGQKSFFFMPHIVSIAEEKMLDPERDAKEIRKIQDVAQQKPAVQDSGFVNPSKLTDMVRNLQKK